MQNRKKKKTQIYRTIFWTLWEKERVGCFKRTASKHVWYLGWSRSPAQVGCMRQALRPGVLGKPRGSGWSGRWKGGSGWGTHVNPWLFHSNVWQNSLQIKKKEKEWAGLCLFACFLFGGDGSKGNKYCLLYKVSRSYPGNYQHLTFLILGISQAFPYLYISIRQCHL